MVGCKTTSYLFVSATHTASQIHTHTHTPHSHAGTYTHAHAAMADEATIPTEAEIHPVLQNMLKNSDLDKTTLRLVMDNLSEHFGVTGEELNVRKKYVRGQIESYLENHYNPEEQGGGDYGMAGASSNLSAAKKRKRNATPGTAKLNGLEKAVILAEPLAEFLGELVLPRTHVAKKIIAYVKENNLQDANDKRKVICNEELKKLFKVDHFTFFSLNKLTINLLYKETEVNDERMKQLCAECNKKTLEEKQAKLDSGEVPEPKAKKSRSTKKLKEAGEKGGERSGGAKSSGPPYRLSKEMAEVCGGEVMGRTEVLQKIWAYIRENDCKGGGKIRCDDKLKAIFDGEESITNFAVTKYIKNHITKIEQE